MAIRWVAITITILQSSDKLIRSIAHRKLRKQITKFYEIYKFVKSIKNTECNLLLPVLHYLSVSHYTLTYLPFHFQTCQTIIVNACRRLTHVINDKNRSDHRTRKPHYSDNRSLKGSPAKTLIVLGFLGQVYNGLPSKWFKFVDPSRDT